ncbi:MAG: SPFH domain-containing protein [Clostridia bacterium]|nr:SPFH domain-containing protein [Clostridia bacterium]
MLNVLLPILAVIGGLLLITLLFGYVKAPPDQAFIISGLRKRIIIGKAAIRIPFLERLDVLGLKMISVDVKTSSFVPTAEFINITVDAAVKIKIGTDRKLLAIAAENFLNRNDDYIITQVQDVLEGNMREIIGQMRLEEMVTNRKAFAEKVQDNAVPDLGGMGLEIISFNVQSFTDQNGIINDLGIDNISQIKKKAAIAKAEAEKEIAKAQAKASKEANDARVEADTQIAMRNNDLRVREAELKNQSDVKQAEADAAYGIQEQEQRKTIEIKNADANIAKQEREAVLKAKEVEVMEKTLEATVKKKAEAELFERQKRAEAELFERQKQAEAELVEAQRQAEAHKLTAEADRYAREQEAEGIRHVGLAEAEAIRAKAIAEAEGIDKKAEAMRKYGEAAVLEMYFAALPEIARNVAEPLSKVDRITMFGEGNSAKLVEDIVRATTQVSDGFTEGMGVDLKSLLAGFVGGRLGGAGAAKPEAEA